MQGEAVVTPVLKDGARFMGENMPNLPVHLEIFFNVGILRGMEHLSPIPNLQKCLGLVQYTPTKHISFVVDCFCCTLCATRGLLYRY